jgi:sterol desaturase/sphingolipid hydroxylase (fatty acid hydroxylase superfamily)
VGALVEAGAVTGYLAYEALHIVIHSERPGGAMLRALRKHHYYHHFADDTKCYGVVTPFWDRIFGSLP